MSAIGAQRNANSVVEEAGDEAGVEDIFHPHCMVCTLQYVLVSVIETL